jgi:hypothetical protein
MARDSADRSLHERLAAALERAAEAQEDSHALMERQLALTIESRETCVCIAERRSERAARRRKYGNGQRGAQERSRPG